MTSCPICQKAVDPIRASHIRVISGRVVPYCSAACRDADAARAAGPLSVPPSPSALAASSASATSSASAASAPAAPSAGEAKASAAAVPGATKKPADVIKGEGKPEPKADVKADAKGKSDAKGKPDAKGKSDAKPDEKSKALDNAKPSDKAGAKGDDKPKTADKAAPKSEAKPDDKSKPSDKSKGEPSTLKADAKAAGADPAKSDAAAPAKAATAVEPTARVRNADEERDATIVPLEPRSKVRFIAVALLVLAVGAVILWQATRGEDPPPPPPPKAVEKLPPPPPPPPPTFEPAQANARAVEVLRQHLTVESPRVRRFAAAALGRLGDADAVKTLLDLLPTEQMEIARLDIAYGLARAGNEEGVKMLVKGLSSPRRDVKGDAARLLAALKDPRAESTLSSLLVLSQFRLGAAEQLARLGNKQAVALLQKLRADEKAPEEDRLRATIALGYAGQPEVAEALRALLPDSRFNVGAAGALAVLHDASARQTLVEQLSIPSLRTSAALALRRLDPELNPATLLYRVMPDLDSIKDTERVAAAEAVLLLTGPATLAERD